MDTNWTENLTPDEAQAALDALKALQATVTAKEAVEILEVRRVLQAKVDVIALPRPAR
jgi:hypothetical protein